MAPESAESRWEAIADSVSNGAAIDWQRVEQEAAGEQDLAVVRALHAIDDIARVHGSTPLPDTRDATKAEPLPAPATDRWQHLVLLECVGQGSSGVVYRAREEGLDREVALKLVWQDSGPAPARLTALLEEPRLLARVRHPHVVTLHGAAAAEGSIGLWMEFVNGRTLEDVLKAQGPFGAREAAAIGLDLCGALAAVHGAGLLHGDVKARNVMREQGGRIVLMDFGSGIDFSIGPAGRGDVRGTPLYLSPELFAGQPASRSADIYSLGVLLFHLVTGSYPVEGRTSEEIRAAHGRRERRRLRDARPDLPDAFVRAVERALAIEPSERYESAGAFADALAVFLGAPTVSVGVPRRTFDRRRLVALAAAVLLVSAPTAFWLWRKAVDSRAPAITGQSGSLASAGGATSASEASRGSAPTGAPASDSYEISAAFHRVTGATDSSLRRGDRLAAGDRLFLAVQSSMPVHVYVVNQDEQGVAVLLFPLPGQKLTNPLPAGALHRLPGLPVTGSEPLYWQVTTAAGRERFFVFASPARQASLEATLAALPRPQLNAPVIAVPLSEEAIGALRSVGGLVKADPKSSDVTSGLAFSFATPLLDTAEQTRGFWAREISFENPVPDTPRGRR